MFVDLDAFDRNARRFIDTARNNNLTLRPASKSIRVPALIQRIFDLGGDTVGGLMCFSASEAQFLAEQGFDDLLVAYPHVQAQDVQQAVELTNQGKSVTLMIDSAAHAERLAAFCDRFEQTTPLRVCIDVDSSLKRLGQHFGPQRSPVRSIEEIRAVIQAVKQHPQLNLVGAMTYEAQVAGIADTSPHQRLINPVIRRIKSASMTWLADYRRQIRDAFAAEYIEMEIFNGGGSGSLAQTATHAALTEITAGSGFLQSHLFDHYEINQSEPALFFALPITRIPQADRVTCQSGGFIASGAPGVDRQPTVSYPQGLTVDAREGFGEVQTPLVVPPELQGKLKIGDPVFFRPAKAGEIAERFNEYCLVRDREIVDHVKTYRGFGKCFF
jgi:D-serine deaminase-like pyridoxal phosphate-dependent protein